MATVASERKGLFDDTPMVVADDEEEEDDPLAKKANAKQAEKTEPVKK